MRHSHVDDKAQTDMTPSLLSSTPARMPADQADFEGAHIRGGLNIGLGGSFATWCGTILDHERPIVLVAEPGREVETATRLGRIGFDNVAGHGNMKSDSFYQCHTAVWVRKLGPSVARAGHIDPRGFGPKHAKER